MMRKRFLATLGTFLLIGVVTVGAILWAKGNRVGPGAKTLFGTGILSITSAPDQASVYIDGHLTTATNANINSLEPKNYDVKIIKDGFIPWQKKVEVKEGLVTKIQATLYPAIPSVYPLTYSGAQNVTASSDRTRIAFIVPESETDQSLTQKKAGVWIWDTTESVGFAKGREPHQIMVATPGVELSKAVMKFSPDANQLLVSVEDRNFLLDANRMNDTPRDITPILRPTMLTWEQEEQLAKATRVAAIKDLGLRQVASSAAVLKWSPDSTKFLYCDSKDTQTPCSDTTDAGTFKVADLTEMKTYTMPAGKTISWLGDSRHLVLTEEATCGPGALRRDTDSQDSSPFGRFDVMF